MERLATVPIGTKISYVMQTAPHIVTGRVARQSGMERLGNAGIVVTGCKCGQDHYVSRHAMVTVVSPFSAGIDTRTPVMILNREASDGVTDRYVVTLPNGRKIMVDDYGTTVDVWTFPQSDDDGMIVSVGDTPEDGFATFTTVADVHA